MHNGPSVVTCTACHSYHPSPLLNPTTAAAAAAAAAPTPSFTERVKDMFKAAPPWICERCGKSQSAQLYCCGNCRLPNAGLQTRLAQQPQGSRARTNSHMCASSTGRRESTASVLDRAAHAPPVLSHVAPMQTAPSCNRVGMQSRDLVHRTVGNRYKQVHFGIGTTRSPSTMHTIIHPFLARDCAFCAVLFTRGPFRDSFRFCARPREPTSNASVPRRAAACKRRRDPV